MSNDKQSTIQQFRQHISQIKYYDEALNVLYWDLRTGAPRKSIEGRSEVIGALSAQLFQLQTAPTLGDWLTELEQAATFASLSEIDQRLVVETRKEYDARVKIPAELNQQYVVLTAKAESLWEVAKEQNDYAMFAPYLDQIIAMQQQFIDLWGAKGATRYDTLLDLYEPGMTTEQLDRIFDQLKQRIVPLAARIASSPHQPETDFLQQTYNKEAQKAFSLYILEQIGFDFTAGRLDESVHPFMTGLNHGDVRITTRYLPEDVTSALFGTIHECGHALYEQNIRPELNGTTLCIGTSMGIHESQSRFWENVIGRSRPFWQKYYPELQKHFPGQLDVSVEQFYRATNTVQPSLVRIEADELTYNLHIIIRYEIEKKIFNEGVTAAELPALWNELYEQYLGVTPPNDAEGVLQDVHWSGGAFGYFPSYALGNMYAAQMTAVLEQQMPDVWDNVAQGKLHPIKQWLTEQVYQYGKLRTPSELIEAIAGKPLDPTYFITYLEQKYSDIYQL